MIGIGIGLSIGSGRASGGGPAPVDPADFIIGDGELGAILALGSAALNGKVIAGEPGADIIGTSAGDSVTFASTLSIPDGLTIRSVDPANPCFLRRMLWAHDGLLTLQQVVIRDTYRLADTYGSTSIARFTSPGAGRSRVTLDRVTAYGGDVTTIDNTLLASGTGAATAAGTVITLTGSPDLSAVPADRSAAILVGGTLRIITGVDNSAKTVTVNNSLTVTGADYTIGFTPQILRIIGQDGSLGNWPDLSIIDCTMRDYEKAVTGTYRAFESLTSLYDKAHGDHVQVAVTGAETKVDFLRNVFRRAYGLSGDPLNPHVDAIQFNCGPMTADNTVPYRAIGNVFFGGPDGRARDQQLIFLENIPSDRRVLADIDHNIGITKARPGYTVERPAAGFSIRGNTVLWDATTAPPTGLTPQIATISGTYPTGDLSGVLVSHNVAPAISALNATVRDNFSFGAATGSNTASIYAGLFAGDAADFDSDNLTGAAQVMAALTPDTTTLWPVGRTRIGAMSGYYDYATGAEDAPWKETGWAASGSWGNLTGQATNTVVHGTKREVTGVSATGVDIWVTGGNAPTLTLYDTDSTTVIVSGVTSVCALAGQWVMPSDTTAATGETLQTVTINAGAAASGTWTTETEVTAYAANWVAFDGVNDWIVSESGMTSGSGKQALVVFEMRVPTTWPSAGAILQFATAGGNIQFQVAFASTRRLNLTARNSGNTTIANWVASNNAFAVDTSYTIAIALDTNTGKGWQVYAKPAAGSWATVSAGTNTFTVDGEMASCTRRRVGASSTAGATIIPLTYLADLWATIGETLDLSVSGNRDKFGPDVDKGSDGSVPTGTSPNMYHTGATGSWHLNAGTGGNATLYGALTTAPSPPNP